MPFGALEDLWVLLGLSRASMGLSESPRPLHVLPKDPAGCKMLLLKVFYLKKAQPTAKIQGEAEV